MNTTVRLLDLETLCAKQESLRFEDSSGYGYHGIMSIKFSGDTREILAGTNQNSLMVYDLISNRVVTKVPNAHSDDINSVCFANREESNIVFSGGDDRVIKVWDRRALGNGLAAGSFIGHAEGITNLSSKGDGIYLASNGKDCLLKIWDLRKMVTPEELPHTRPIQNTHYDYRSNTYPWKNK